MRPVLVVLALLGLALGFSLDTFLEQRQAGERQGVNDGVFDGDNRLALGAVFVAILAAATLREALKNCIGGQNPIGNIPGYNLL